MLEVKPDLKVQVLSIQEVADLLESAEKLGESDFGVFKLLKLQTYDLGEFLCVTSHGERHLVIHTAT